MKTLYFYKNCDSCRKAIKFLDAKGQEYRKQDIVLDAAPDKSTLQHALETAAKGNIRKLFNTSGMVYREMQLRDKLGDMSDEEALELLAANGKLIKRPILLEDTGGLIGFKQVEWESYLD